MAENVADLNTPAPTDESDATDTPPIVVPTADPKDADMVAKLVRDRLDNELKPIKGKLDNAFKARDEALAKVAEFEKREREANLKQLEAEGKHREAFELRLAEERALNATLRAEVTKLSRDVSVKDALKSYSFRNDNAADMAFKEIVGNLVQNDQGQWVHRSGITVRDYCEAFSKDENQSFLFKQKANTGTGASAVSGTSGVPGSSTGKKSLFDMSQAEVLKMAAEGKIGRKTDTLI